MPAPVVQPNFPEECLKVATVPSWAAQTAVSPSASSSPRRSHAGHCGRSARPWRSSPRASSAGATAGTATGRSRPWANTTLRRGRARICLRMRRFFSASGPDPRSYAAASILNQPIQRRARVSSDTHCSVAISRTSWSRGTVQRTCGSDSLAVKRQGEPPASAPGLRPAAGDVPCLPHPQGTQGRGPGYKPRPSRRHSVGLLRACGRCRRWSDRGRTPRRQEYADIGGHPTLEFTPKVPPLPGSQVEPAHGLLLQYSSCS